MNKQNTAEKFIELLEIVEKLRGPDGCPWDKEQTHASLLPYFLEEAYEVIESVEEEDWNTFVEELCDIILHLYVLKSPSNPSETCGLSERTIRRSSCQVQRHENSQKPLESFVYVS